MPDSANNVGIARSIRDLFTLDPVAVGACTIFSVGSVAGIMMDFGKYVPSLPAWVILPLCLCARLMLTARIQFKKLGIRWSEETVTRDRAFVVVAGVLFLIVCWTTALVISQVTVSTRVSLPEVLGLTGGSAFVAGFVMILRARTPW